VPPRGPRELPATEVTPTRTQHSSFGPHKAQQKNPDSLAAAGQGDNRRVRVPPQRTSSVPSSNCKPAHHYPSASAPAGSSCIRNSGFPLKREPTWRNIPRPPHRHQTHTDSQRARQKSDSSHWLTPSHYDNLGRARNTIYPHDPPNDNTMKANQQG